MTIKKAQNKTELRKILRKRRNAIDSQTKERASIKLCENVEKLDVFTNAHEVGVYINLSEEAPTDGLRLLCHSLNKSVYAPVITQLQLKKMQFARVDHNDQTLVPNQLNILEPNWYKNELIDINTLDIVFMPLLGFDRTGNRIGMGAGYYDRALMKNYSQSSKKHVLNKKISSPTLIGLAFLQQELPNVPNDPWDVPLDCIITPEEIIRINL